MLIETSRLYHSVPAETPKFRRYKSGLSGLKRKLVNRSSGTLTGERRRKERVYIPFPATVEGVDTDGEQFKINTVLDNLSHEGLYLRMMPSVKIGSKLSVTFRLSSAASLESENGQPPRVLVHGTVLRAEEKMGGAYGIAVKINPAKFIGGEAG